MQLPYGIEEQYLLFRTFLLDPSQPSFHIEQPFPETEMILQVALQELDTNTIRIQLFESDSCVKRILTDKKTGQTKRIILSKPCASTWVWKRFSKFSLLDSVIYR